MAKKENSRNTISVVILNSEGLYEGDLRHYLNISFNHARNLRSPYHNFRHVFHVLGSCYAACRFYSDVLTPNEMRNLLIAAMFHDFDHPGRTGNDDLNVVVAIRALRKHITKEDLVHFEEISELMRTTEFPHRVTTIPLNLQENILRDADASQVLSPDWVQQVILGLSAERSMSPMNVLKMQEGFLSNLVFGTEWARQTFSEEMIASRIKESRELIEILG